VLRVDRSVGRLFQRDSLDGEHGDDRELGIDDSFVLDRSVVIAAGGPLID